MVIFTKLLIQKNDSWSSPKPILYKNKAISNKINSSYFESSASITEDESYIYFVSERVSGFGKTDIYCVKKEGKNYLEPENLGNKINSSGDENVYLFTLLKTIVFHLTEEMRDR